jgi:type I restriction enzyme M protein
MFAQTFRNIDDVLWKEAGCSSELDYVEQTSWMLFLKYLDDLERDRAAKAELQGKSYEHIIDEPHRWSAWAAPKTADGRFDHDNALTGDDLIAFVNDDLFPYLKGFRRRARRPGHHRVQDRRDLRRDPQPVPERLLPARRAGARRHAPLRQQREKHELSQLYEEKIQRMGNAGRNGGEYYTPRPLIRAMVQVVRPEIGERVYDGAVGSAGFLCEAHDYLRRGDLTTGQLHTLRARPSTGRRRSRWPTSSRS